MLKMNQTFYTWKKLKDVNIDDLSENITILVRIHDKEIMSSKDGYGYWQIRLENKELYIIGDHSTMSITEWGWPFTGNYDELEYLNESSIFK